MKRPFRVVGDCGVRGQAGLFLTLLMMLFSLGAWTELMSAEATQPRDETSEAPALPLSSGDITIGKDQVAESDVITVSHSVLIEGHARHSVASLGGSVVVNGVVDGDVAALGGDVWLGANAVVGGDLIVLGGRLFHSPGARIAGRSLATTYFREELQRTFSRQPRSVLQKAFTANAMLWRSARILAWFIVAVLVILFVPIQTAFAMDRLERDFARIAAIGLLALIVFIGLLALFSMLIKIVIGIPLVFLLMLSLFAMWAFGAVAFYLAVGRLFVRWVFKRPFPMAVYALLGLILWSILSFVPFLNLFIPYVVFILALGTSLATKFGTGKPWFVRAA